MMCLEIVEIVLIHIIYFSFFLNLLGWHWLTKLYRFQVHHSTTHHLYTNTILFFKILFIYFREGKGGRKRERNINVLLTLMRPLLGTWPATQACALSGNCTVNPLVCRPVLNPLNHISQDYTTLFKRRKFPIWVFSHDILSFDLWYYKMVMVSKDTITLRIWSLNSKNHSPFPKREVVHYASTLGSVDHHCWSFLMIKTSA